MPSAALGLCRRHPVLIGALALFLLLAIVYQASIPLRATRGASITGDEPFYLVTTQSLLQDGDLDLRQQYATHSYRSFFDHSSGLWSQSVPRGDGAIVSPHDPGLSVLLLPGFGLGGLKGAQVQLTLLAALTFALAYVLAALETRAFLTAWLATAAIALTATAFVYASEVYPELPGALCLLVSLLLVRRTKGVYAAVGLALLLSALAWLGIKYVPLGGLVALFFLARADQRARIAFVALTAVSGAFYVWFHYHVFGDLTPYSINAVYRGAPAIVVLEHHVAFSERFYRLWGLFIDQRFGIGRWAPVVLLVPISLPLLVRGPIFRRLVGALIVTQVLIATFVAITMMGWWFSGRTLALVLPLWPLVLTMLLLRAGTAMRVLAAGLATYSVVVTYTLAAAARSWDVLVAVNPYELHGSGFDLLARVFPNYTSWGSGTVVLTAAWLIVFLPVILWSLEREAGLLRRLKARKFVTYAHSANETRAKQLPLSYD